MMVTAADDSDMSLVTILSTLESKTSSSDDRIEAYTQFSNHMKEDDLSLFNLDVANNADQVWTQLQKDILSENTILAQSALQVLGFFLHDADNIQNLSSTNSASVIPVLYDCILKADDKTSCTRALWCLSKQNLAVDIVSKNIETMMKAAEFTMEKWKSQSITAENEACNVITRLVEVCPKEMTSHVVQWGKLVLPLLVHSAVKIREKALEFVTAKLSTLMTNQKELAQFLVADFNKKFGGEMKKLFGTRNEIHVLKSWGIIVQILGEELHHGSFINHILPIAELGFKSSNVEVKCVSFQAWQQLIDNFAANNSILTDPKRIKLIMQVFKLNNAKVEKVAMVKLQVWWHFIWLLGAKASAHFDQVCVPLLHFCVGGGKLGSPSSGAATPRALKAGTSPMTPQMNLSNLGSPSVTPVIPSLQQKGCEVLAHILGSMPDDVGFTIPQYTLDPLSHDLITGPSFFYKHANLLIQCTTELICSLGNALSENLLYQVWYALISHVKNALEHLKLEMREILTSFLTQFQIIVLSQARSQKETLKMFEVVCCLPKKSLISTAYNVSNGERIHGTPSLFLTELLLTPVLLTAGGVTESYMVLFDILMDCGFSMSSGTLEFCHSVVRMLEQNVDFAQTPETVWRLWSSIVNPLHEYMKKTNEVNQGDALEHNFSCLYLVLMFPLQQGLATKMPQASVKTMLKTWCDIYKTFARLSALVTNADANICCEELCHKMVKACSKDNNTADPSYLDFITQCGHVIVNAIDFSSLGSVPTFNLNGLSPAKWAKKKQRPMDNIQSLVAMCERIMNAIVTMAIEGDSGKKPSGGISLQNTAITAVEVLTTLFTHVTSTNILSSMIGHLSQPISALLQGSAKKVAAKLYSNAFQQKLEKLWQIMTTTLQNRFSGQADSEMLAKLSPLLEATFLHPRRGIKNITTSFWKSFFSQSAPLDYPESLKPVLCKVKEKTAIILPGWSAIAVPIIEETPISQLSQAESQAPEPHLPGLPSPVKLHGSFLNKVVSPNIKKSPAKPAMMETKGRETAKRDILSLHSMKNDDFVVIKSPPKKKRVLTEHQKEVFREKKSFPAMYNTLDVSQDVSMMASQFSNETSQMGTPPPPSTEPVIVLGSSGSQSSEPKIKSPYGDKNDELLTVEEKTSNAKPGTVTEKPLRRRSVRFKDNDKQDEVDSLQSRSFSPSSALDDIESKSIEHFSIIKQAIGQSSEQAPQVEKPTTQVEKPTTGMEEPTTQVEKPTTGVEKPTAQGEKSTTGARKPTAQGEDHPEPEPTGNQSGRRSSGESSAMASIPQNPMGVIGLFDQLGSKSSSLESRKSDKSLSQEKSSVIDYEASAMDSDKLNQPLLSWTNKLTALSQSSPKGSQSPMPSQSPKSSQEKIASLSQKSPKNGKALESSSQGKLDNWLGQLSQHKQEADKMPKVPDSQTKVVTVVEETQSPTECMKDNQSLAEGTLPAILETPPHPQGVTVSKGSHKKLFDSDNTNLIDMTEDSNIIPASPPNVKNTFATRIGTPVLKLKRLTDDEIRQFSPTGKHRSQSEEIGTPKGKQQNLHNKSQTCSDDSQNADITKTSSHEHDDFSEIRPLDSEDIVPCSQGFEPSLICGQSKIVAFKNTDKDDTITASGLSGNTEQDRICGTDNVIDNEESLPQTLESQNLFTEDKSESVSDELYDPGLDSTFKHDGATPKLFNTKNLVKSIDTEKSSLSTSEDFDFSVVESESNPKTYDPKEESTMASDVETPRRSKKRKQPSPKYLSPDSVKPKRVRKTPKKYLQDDSDEIVRVSSRRGPATLTPKSATRRRSQLRSSTEKCDEKVQKNGPIEVSVDVHMSDENVQNKTSCGKDENMNDSGKLVESVGLKSVVQNSIDDIGQNSIRMIVDDNKLAGDKEKKDICDVSGELEKAIGEKTPEGRTSRSTPLRKSTAKTKKEVVQKRAKHVEKTVVINSGVSNLDSDSTDEEVDSGSGMKTDSTKMKFVSALIPEESVDSIRNDEPTCTEKTSEDVTSGKDRDVENNDVSGVASVTANKQGDTNDTGSKSEKRQIFSETSQENNEDDNFAQTLPNITDNSKKCRESDSDENVPLSQIVLKVTKAATSDDKIEDTSCDNSVDENKDTVSNDVKEIDVIDLTSSQSQNEKRTRKKKVVHKANMSTRLRSSGIVLRTGKKATSNVGLKESSPVKSLQLKKTAQRKNGIEGITETSKGDCKNITNQKDENDIETQDPNGTQEPEKGEHSKSAKEVVPDQNLGDKPGNECFVTEKHSEDDNTETAGARNKNDLDETPRKIPDKSLLPSGCTLFESQSDSKLITASRKFNKGRRTVARRSILKQPSPTQDSGTLSSPTTRRRFHPIRVGQVYSPSASPSAGILKRRRLSGDSATNSPSPPSKQRRVYFAHPLTVEQESQKVVNEETEHIKASDSARPHSPLVTATVTKVTSSVEKFFTIPTSVPTNHSARLSAAGTEESQLSQTQCTYKSTQESQLNVTDPIYPELLECPDKVDKILPQLTESMWMRGLGHVVRSRKIHTIGDLSGLTEREVNSLPIKSPKVAIVRSVLKKFETQLEAKKLKSGRLDLTAVNEKVKDDTNVAESEKPVETEEEAPLQNMEAVMSELDNDKDAEDEDLNSSISEMMNTSADLLEKMDKMTHSDVERSDRGTTSLYKGNGSSTEKEAPAEPVEVDSKSGPSDLLHSLQDIVNQCNNSQQMNKLKTEEIFQIHHHLTNLTGTIMSALKARCHSPVQENS